MAILQAERRISARCTLKRLRQTVTARLQPESRVRHGSSQQITEACGVPFFRRPESLTGRKSAAVLPYKSSNSWLNSVASATARAPSCDAAASAVPGFRRGWQPRTRWPQHLHRPTRAFTSTLFSPGKFCPRLGNGSRMLLPDPGYMECSCAARATTGQLSLQRLGPSD